MGSICIMGLALMSWGARKLPRGVSLGKIKVRGVRYYTFPRGESSEKLNVTFAPVNMDFSHFMAYFSEGGFRLHKIVRGGYFLSKKAIF